MISYSVSTVVIKKRLFSLIYFARNATWCYPMLLVSFCSCHFEIGWIISMTQLQIICSTASWYNESSSSTLSPQVYWDICLYVFTVPLPQVLSIVYTLHWYFIYYSKFCSFQWFRCVCLSHFHKVLTAYYTSMINNNYFTFCFHCRWV